MLPESSIKKQNEGTVVAVGNGARDVDGDVSLFFQFLCLPFYTSILSDLFHFLLF